MNGPLNVNGPVNMIILVAAIIALLTQPQIRIRIPSFFGVDLPVLQNWHCWAGRIALGGFVLNYMLFPLVGMHPATPADLRYSAHSVLSTLCAVAVLRKIWLTWREDTDRTKWMLPWSTAVFGLGASFFTLSCALAAWRWANPTGTWGEIQWLVFKAATLGHVGLAIALIWLGRLALRSLPSASGR